MPWVRTGDILTACESRGEGFPLVFISGAWVSRHLWDGQVAALAPSCQAITYDLRGQGETGGSSRRRYSVDLYTEDLLALLDGLSLRNVILCGLSLGGFIAMCLAARHPERVWAMILADTAASTALTLSDRWLRRLEGVPCHVLTPLIRAIGVQGTVETAFRIADYTAFKRWIGITPEVRAELKSLVASPNEAEFIKTFLASHEFDCARLPRITAPTLVLNGVEEPQLVHRRTAELRRHLTCARVAEVPGAGHIANLANPDGFNAEVIAFLRRQGLLSASEPGTLIRHRWTGGDGAGAAAWSAGGMA